MYKPSRTEQNNVISVYEIISKEFSDTRRSVWKGVQEFLGKLETKLTGIEIGCGNGKNMLFRDDLIIEGIDTCEGFIEICKNKKLSVEKKNILDMENYEKKYDFAISIAVFHHICKEKNRLRALMNMIGLLKEGGKGLISVWSYEQDIDSKKTFEIGDNMVKWHKRKKMENGTQEFDIYDRYYYVYDRDTFYRYLLNCIEYIKIDKIFNEKGNWFCEFTKK